MEMEGVFGFDLVPPYRKLHFTSNFNTVTFNQGVFKTSAELPVS